MGILHVMGFWEINTRKSHQLMKMSIHVPYALSHRKKKREENNNNRKKKIHENIYVRVIHIISYVKMCVCVCSS